jgi:hypothetical protein
MRFALLSTIPLCIAGVVLAQAPNDTTSPPIGEGRAASRAIEYVHIDQFGNLSGRAERITHP